jgi:hypothetical protein
MRTTLVEFGYLSSANARMADLNELTPLGEDTSFDDHAT